MNLLYKTTRFFVPFCLLFGFAFAQDAGDGPTVSAMGTVTATIDANYVTTVEIGGKTYALVTGFGNNSVQIMDITNPASPKATATVTDEESGYTELANARGIATVETGGKTYALVTGYADEGVQIINITNPASPIATATMKDGENGFTELDGAAGITTVVIDDKTYALVTGYDDDGVEIINITDPTNPSHTAAVKNGVGGFTVLGGPVGITTAEIGGKTYALVVSSRNHAVQIIDISDPANPKPTAAVEDGKGGFTTLYGGTTGGVTSITTVTMGDKTYALVASFSDDGVQIMDISDPANPTATAAVKDGKNGFTTLENAWSVATVSMEDKTYALVSSFRDSGVQIMDISDPASPTAMAAVTDDNSGEFTALAGARGITMTQINGNTYALVASYIDDAVQIMGINSSGDTLGTGGSEALHALALYPNPVTHTLHIQSPLASELSYRIYDLTGKALSTHHQSGQSHSIDLSGLAKGIYFLKATHKNNTTAMQFVKQ